MKSTLRARLTRLLPFLLSLFVAGCGGGGGGSGAPGPGGDTTPPQVTAVSVCDGAVDVGVGTVLQATFSEAVKNVGPATFLLKDGAGGAVPGVVTASGNTATFTPSANLAYLTTYTATVSAGVTDLANNALAADRSWSFTTAPPPDTTQPTVNATSPPGGQIGVAVSALVQATFSEAVKNVGPATFLLKDGAGGAVPGVATASGNTATFTPSANLAYLTTYTATVTTGVIDLANNALAADHSWSFTTGAAPDTTPPTVNATSPPGGQTGVAVSDLAQVSFSEAVKNVGPATFLLKDGAGRDVPGVVTASGSTAAFTPSTDLAYLTTYTATVTRGVTDLANNALAADCGWSFTTGPAPNPCLGCHGGVDGSQPGVNGAPVVTMYWQTSGHGRPFSSRGARGVIACEECHDVGYLSSADHKTDGTAGSGPPPANVNTLAWPGKTDNGNNLPNANTSHLKRAYFPSSTTYKRDFARAFNGKCGDPATGCHRFPPHNNHPQVPAGSVDPADNVMRFGDGSTLLNPKAYSWYPESLDYRTGFYESRSPLEIEDLTTSASGVGPDSGIRYGTCVTCHDPHGTGATDQILRGGNGMLRGNFTDAGQFCNRACHTTRTPP